MKKFFAVMFSSIFAISIIFPSMAIAEKSEREELYDTLQVGKVAFTATDDYADIVNHRLYAVAVSRIADYSRVADETKKLFDSAPVGYVKRCAWEIDMIINARLATVKYFVTALNCYSVGDKSGYDYYAAQMEYYGIMAKDLRQTFQARYGF